MSSLEKLIRAKNKLGENELKPHIITRQEVADQFNIDDPIKNDWKIGDQYYIGYNLGIRRFPQIKNSASPITVMR